MATTPTPATPAPATPARQAPRSAKPTSGKAILAGLALVAVLAAIGQSASDGHSGPATTGGTNSAYQGGGLQPTPTVVTEDPNDWNPPTYVDGGGIGISNP